MWCPSCRTTVEAGHRFCHECGAPLPEAGSAADRPTVTPPPPPSGGAPTLPSPIPPTMTAGISAPLSVPHLAPAPTFQPVPGGAPQPTVAPATAVGTEPEVGATPSSPAPVAETPTVPLSVTPVPISSVPTLPVAIVPAATEPLPIVTDADTTATVPTAVIEPGLFDATPAALVRTEPTPAVPTSIGVDSLGNPVPPPPLTVGEPIVSTEPIAVVEQATSVWSDEPTAEQRTVAARSGATTQLPTVDDHQFRLTALLVVAVLTAVVSVAAAVLEVVSYLVTGTDSASATLVLDDLSSNHLIGVGIGVFALLIGAVVGATGRRSGAGLAAGAALGLAGLLLDAVGHAIDRLDEIEVTYLKTAGNTITSTREIGFFLAIAGAALAGLAFAVSLGAARGGGRARVALVLFGVLATAAAVVGPLVPLNDGTWLDNWSQAGVPDATLWLRLAVLVLFLVGGVTAFAVGGRFGGSMALGLVAIGVFQSVMAYLDLGELPLGFADGNFFGADGGVEVEPHLVTIAGLLAVVVLGVLTIVIPTRRRD